MAARAGLDAATPHASHSPQLPLLGGGALFAIAIVAAGSASSRNALLVLGLSAGVVGLGAIVRFAPRTACDSLLLLFVGLVAVPIDGHLAYREHIGGWPGLRFALADIPLLLLCGVTALGVLVGGTASAIPRRIVLLMAVLVVWYAAAALGAPDRLLAGFDLLATVRGFAIAWIVASLFRRDLLGAILALLALQVILHSSFAVAQGVTGRPIGAGWFGGLDELLGEPLEGRGLVRRPAGLFTHPITYAGALLITLPLLLAGLSKQRGVMMRMLLLAALALGGVGLVLSLSRGVWISMVVAMGVLGAIALRRRLLSSRQIRMILIGGFAVVLVFGAAFGSRIYDRFTKSDASNLESRLGMNAIALRMIAANPVLGTGPNNYALNLPRYDVKGFMDDYPAPVHNLYLLEAAEAGIPGLLLFVALMGAILMAATQRLPRMHDRELQWIVAALVAGLIGILFAQISDFSFRLEPLRSMIWLEVGLLFGVLQVDRIPRVAGHGAATG